MLARAVLALSLCAIGMLAGCATARTHRELQEFLAEFPAKREAWAAAQARLRQACEVDPSPCAPRWVRASNTELSRWEQRTMPPYEVIVAVHEEESRARVKLRLADEYGLGVVRGIAAQVDAGQISDEDGKRLVDQTFAQVAQALRRELWSLHQSYLLAEQRDQETLTAFLNTFLVVAAAGLNAYAATLPRPVVVSPPPPPAAPLIVSAPRPITTLPPVIVGCTYRLNALHGMMLCVASDGRVVAR